MSKVHARTTRRRPEMRIVPPQITLRTSEPQRAVNVDASYEAGGRTVSADITLDYRAGCLVELQFFGNEGMSAEVLHERSFGNNETTLRLQLSAEMLPLFSAVLAESVRHAQRLRLAEITEAPPEEWTVASGEV